MLLSSQILALQAWWLPWSSQVPGRRPSPRLILYFWMVAIFSMSVIDSRRHEVYEGLGTAMFMLDPILVSIHLTNHSSYYYCLSSIQILLNYTSWL
ncbi:hypothetical protein N7453_008382 [Penicillium expansum]|nr:hypothetical protein N7453_008382 [Penicillium expansum]